MSLDSSPRKHSFWVEKEEASINWNIRQYFSLSLSFVYFLGDLAICRLENGGVGRACGFY